ncbi:MAG: DUF4105 domain-containing protein [Bacteriovorax sp.]|jgi:hypothetical protein
MKALKNWLLLFACFAVNVQAADVSDYINEARSPLFQNISGWMSKGLLIKKRINLNKAFDRSPNPQEFNSVEDTFRINYEFFMKDPEFKCRRPTYYKYFAALLKTTPFADVECKMNNQVTLISESSNGSAPMIARKIDPSRIYQIHYLFAGKGKQMMSRWGHAMFRIVLCAPGRTEVGPECLQDFAHHIVVSYRANIEDMNIDYAKGMNGAYASQLFLMNMSEVVAEYTKGEFRDVISLPMRMTAEEINHFTDKLLENYWSYKGQYFFLTNNCATEAMNLLRAAFPNNSKIQTVNIASPLGMYDYLVKNKITDPNILNDRKAAKALGYLFPGVSEKLEKSLNLFAKDINLSFEDFALKLSPTERKALYEQKANELEGNNGQMSLLANALRLEEQILLSREQQFAKKIGNALFGKEPMPELKDTIIDEKILELKNLYKKMTSESYLAKGYGIPLENEFRVASPESIKAIQDEIQVNMEELKQIAVKFFPDEVEEMKGAIENRHWIMAKIDLL